MNSDSSQNSLENLRQLLEYRAAKKPQKDFLFSAADDRRFTYAEFDTAVNRAACMLASRGVHKGDSVSLLLPNSPEYVIAYFACWKLGALAGPINSLLKAQEMAYVISDSEAKALLVHPDFLPLIKNIRTEHFTLRAVIPFSDGAHATTTFNGEPPSLPDSSIKKDDEAIIIYTSGTTG